ncbi:MAG: hypothetical protein ACLRMJ_06380 [Alistipes finegoldii]
MLSLLDYRGKIGRIDWYIDNRKTENTYDSRGRRTHHHGRRHRRRRGSQQYIVKYITVK